ncbi:acyl carrier protein [Gordonia crocea]|uniref:Carrier domain-containing protein n=1 Tax=Gordonia crocea TaxID=589162 RepID=A0A7I9V0G6_9ACTN|nr:acyl carrier protein [Gordonia crocea]GED98560.1 hypothetical protein nbrc107697_25990 [Gordonia crocea]
MTEAVIGDIDVVYAEVQAVLIGEGLLADRLKPGARFDDLGVDSISVVTITERVEKRLGISVPDDTLEALQTVDELVDAVLAARAR